MYELNDTITAVSSPSSDNRVIIRISGPDTIDKVSRLFVPAVENRPAGIINGSISVEPGLVLDAKLYLFWAPRSYTGETLAEIHINTNPTVTEALISRLLANGLRLAGPGEFTARAYLNGKMDLSQAEAVNEVIVSSNRFQLASAEKLLAGRLAQTTEKLRVDLMDCLSLIEAGMDFSGEDIEFISTEDALARLEAITSEFSRLISGSISCEAVVDLPAVGIAGAPNAGKSSLLNNLLRKERSIVSSQSKTTRDILCGRLSLAQSECVLFDCAGLITEPETILDELAQEAATEALNKAAAVIFCVDLDKKDLAEDVAICRLIKTEAVTFAATKSDLLCKDDLAKRLEELNALFKAEFMTTSSKTGQGIDALKETIDEHLVCLSLPGVEVDRALRMREAGHGVVLTARHKQAVTEAIENITEAAEQLRLGNDEVAAMLLRAGYQEISGIEFEHIDEKILEKIFSNFCIGK